MLEKGLVDAHGSQWKQSRKILADLFTYARLKSLEDAILNITIKYIQNLDK
jgi:cytochrome P450